MKTKTLLHFFIYLSLSISVARCNNSSSLENQIESIGFVDTGECLHSPYKGGGANTEAKSFLLETNPYFNKKIVLSHLDSLLNTSGVESFLYVRRKGVQIYKVTEKANAQCRYFAFARNPPAELSQAWQERSSATASTTSSLLGLFRTQYRRETGSGRVWLNQSSILLREDTQRWTLLHEFAHFLFAQGRATEVFMKFNEEIFNELKASKRKQRQAAENFQNNSTRQNAQKLVKAWENTFRLSHKFHKRNELEEFSIESLLVDRLTTSELKLVNNTTDLRNAINYMSVNKKKVERRYNNLAQILENYREQFDPSWQNLIERTHKIERKINRNLNFLDKKMRAAVERQHSDAVTNIMMLNIPILDEINEGHAHHYDPRFDELQNDVYEL